MSEERETHSAGVMIGTIIALNADEKTCAVKAIPGHVSKLRDMPFMRDVAVMRSGDWYATAKALERATTRIVEFECEAAKLRAGISRIGHERDQMVAANVELQERLSRLEDDLK